MTLREVFQGISTMWNWYIDLPIWVSLPLGFGAFIAVVVGVFVVMVLMDDSTPSG